MSADRFPPIAELVPQQGPMCLLDRVLAHEEDQTRCAVRTDASALFRDARGCVPSWVGLEYMAQCAAAHGGLRRRRDGEPPLPGLFLGSRRVVFRRDHFEPGRVYEVTARRVSGRERRYAFECAVHDPAGGAPLVTARLNLLVSRIPDGLDGGLR